MKKVIIATLVMVLFAVSAAALSVPEGHVGVVVKWGKAVDTVLQPGWHWTNPISTDVYMMDCRWQKYLVTTQAFSKDIQQVDIQMSMSYQLHKDGALSMYRNVGMDYPDKIMLPRLLDALKSTFAKYSAEELVANRQQISDLVYQLLREELAIYDVTVKEVAIEDIDFTDAFTDAIEAKQVATQNKLRVQTEQEQQTIVAKAEAERARVKAQADADVARISAEAEAYRQEQESKTLNDRLLWKTALERWDGKLPTILGGDATKILTINPAEGGTKDGL